MKKRILFGSSLKRILKLKDARNEKKNDSKNNHLFN